MNRDGRLSRRDLLATLAAVPVVIATEGGPEAIVKAAEAARKALVAQAAGQEVFEPVFFTDHEWQTVRQLVDYIIPADERSGSATDAGVPEFMDFWMTDRPGSQTGMREGLGWLDTEAGLRFGAPFVEYTDPQRRVLLDSVAWPGRAGPAVAEGVRFFTMFRDLTASGFWSSETGVADLGYIGNDFIENWTGCPDDALRKLGVSYEEDWER